MKKKRTTKNQQITKNKQKHKTKKQKRKKTRKIMLLFHDKSSEMNNLILK